MDHKVAFVAAFRGMLPSSPQPHVLLNNDPGPVCFPVLGAHPTSIALPPLPAASPRIHFYTAKPIYLDLRRCESIWKLIQFRTTSKPFRDETGLGLFFKPGNKY